jgi:hypothetical protein
MSSNIYKEEPKNSIELRRIYDMVAKISCDLANNYENPEIDTWLKHYWGAWPVDNKDKTIRRLLQLTTEHKALQPWHKILKNDKVVLNVVGEKEVSNKSGPFGHKSETLYTLSDRTEILYIEEGGRGGSCRSWNIVTTGKLFSQISYQASLPLCYGNGYNSIDRESLGRLISIKEPRLVLPRKQHGDARFHQSVSYELEFEKRNELSQITLHLHPDVTFDSLFLVTFFGVDPSTIEASNNNFPKYIYTAAEDVSLVRLYPKEIGG